MSFHFGPNKQQELLRLLFEVSKRDKKTPGLILREAYRGRDFKDAKQAFFLLKQRLLQRRYPQTFTEEKSSCFYLPKIHFDDRCVVNTTERPEFYPETIFIEQDAGNYQLTNSILKRFPLAKQVPIPTLRHYLESQKGLQQQSGERISTQRIQQYNERTRKLFLVKERYDFLKACPCTPAANRCGYQILNMGFGCIYDCSYCFLQGYANSIGIVVPVNGLDFLTRLQRVLRNRKAALRVGTGEFCDSLALDGITGFAPLLIDFFSHTKNATIELKTKSANVKHLLSLRHNRRSIIAWSLNPPSLIASDELKTDGLEARLEAARQCVQSGYLVAFHFDPIIYSDSWEGKYRGLIDALFLKLKGNERSIAWISLGTLRFNPQLKTVIEQRFPKTALLEQELILEFDKKLRYSRQLRFAIYKTMHAWIRKHSLSVPVYLCMEPASMWKAVLSRSSFKF